jgi:hypothetical protein
MILFSSYKGTIFHLIPMPFLAMGRCEICNAPVLLLGLSIGNRIFTIQLHLTLKESSGKSTNI